MLNRIFFITNIVILIGMVSFFAFDWDSSGTIEASRIILKGANGTPNIILQGNDENTLITLNDANGNVRLQLQGGVFPAVIMKNEEGEIVGTFFPLRDGGAALGLGDRTGNMATFIRGGETPMMNFYQGSHEPNIAMGIANDLPHFVMIPKEGGEGVIIHGHTPPSLLFVDEEGKVPVSLSRHGLLHEVTEQRDEEALAP
ncbi:hypothetical protein [Candidatus Neptunochlamydia vexilliferae]|uniref:hypothetical protein n=1 Tax=Candidatus Neptunichlamydia vexilliferae TaxID=1651774 RepID=UPI001891D11C|nr:hypothetical protein [Candidatus Neptunochlamydia vexilliferae]